MKYCYKCGAQLPDDANFCGYCGVACKVCQQEQINQVDYSASNSQPQPAPYVPQTVVEQPQPTPYVPQVPVQQPQPVQSAPTLQATAVPLKLYMNPKATFAGYNFNVVDANGNLLYKVESVGSIYLYKARICYPDGTEILRIEQSKKATWMTLKFEIYSGDRFITHINQEIRGTHYVYDVPELGLFIDGSNYAISMDVHRNNEIIAHVAKKVFSFGDTYELSVNNPADAHLMMAAVMVVQLCIGHARRRRRR